jgi:hypothetical protein
MPAKKPATSFSVPLSALSGGLPNEFLHVCHDFAAVWIRIRGLLHGHAMIELSADGIRGQHEAQAGQEKSLKQRTNVMCIKP